jgi:hypothetical protein
VSEHATEIDVAGASEALEARLEPTRATIEVGRDEQSGKFQSLPKEAATPAAGEAEAEVPGATPGEGTPAQQTPTEDEAPSFTHIPDEALTPELLAVKRSMQGHFTQKTQEVAELRKVQEEFGFESPAQLRAAVEAYQTLSNPENWPRLHQELSQHLQSQGLPSGVADQAAAVTLGEAVGDLPDGGIPDITPVDDLDFEAEDGATAALAAQLKQMQAQQAQLVSYIRETEQRQQQEAQLHQLAQQMTQDEHVIRQAHKDMDPEALEEYIETVYGLEAAAGDGDLHKAAAQLDNLLGRQASTYLTSKQQALRVPGPVPGAGVIPAEEEEPPHTLEEGHERAMAYVRRLEAQEAGQAGY